MEKRYRQSNKPTIYRLKRSLSNVRQDAQSIAKYRNTINGLWDELDQVRTVSAMSELESYHSEERVFQFLVGLNDSYQQLRSQILAMEPFPDMDRVLGLLFQEEEECGLHHLTLTDHTAMAAIKPQPFPSSSKSTTKDPSIVCTHCGGASHIKNGCFQLVGYPAW